MKKLLSIALRKIWDCALTAALLFLFAFAFAKASAVWWSLPDAASWSQLSSTAWNDVISHVNSLASTFSVSSWNAAIWAEKTFSTGKVQILDTVTAWSACATNWLVARNVSWALLSCQAGTWKMSGWSDTALTATNWYTKLPSGIILQWATYASSTTATSRAYVTPFPNAAFIVTTSCVTGYDTVNSFTATTFNSNSSGGWTCRYFAIWY